MVKLKSYLTATASQGPPTDIVQNLWFTEVFKNFLSSPHTFSINCDICSLTSPWNSCKFLLLTLFGFIFAFLNALLGLIKYRIFKQEPNFKLACAIYPEISNRTRHLTKIFDSTSCQPDACLVLGRNNLTFVQTKNICKKLFPSAKPRIFLPYDVFAIIRSIPYVANALITGSTSFGYCLRWMSARDLIASSYRVYIGCFIYAWLKGSSKFNHGLVMFGMSGTADSIALELGLRLTNSKSIHCIHGQAVGFNFLSCADIGIFQSAYDATHYQKMNWYGRCISFALNNQRPQLRAHNGLIFFSNLSHPSNPAFQTHGLRDELNALKVVANLALIDSSFFPLVWKPHPATISLDANLFYSLKNYAEKLGFSVIINPIELSNLSKEYRYIITTPSTIAIDCLKTGILPIILDLQNSLPGTSLSCFPFASAGEQLPSIIEGIETNSSYYCAYSRVLNSVNPSRDYDLNDLLGMVYSC